MRLIYDIPNEVNRYGSMKFFEAVRENLMAVIEAGDLEIAEHNIRQFYQDYAWAYIIAAKSKDAKMLSDLLTVSTFDPIGEWSEVTDSSGLEIQLGAKPTDPRLADNLLVIDDKFSEAEDETLSFLCAEGEGFGHLSAVSKAQEQLTHELATQTGLAALIESMLPGTLITYLGESFEGMVVICNETLLGRGGNF